MSGGLHGVGVSVVNALSERLKVWIKRDGKEHYMDFVRGTTQTKLKVLGDVPKKQNGTKIWFKPDHEIFTELTLQLRHARLASPRAVLPEQGRHDHAQGRARRAGEGGDLPGEERAARVRAAPQHEPEAAAPRGRSTSRRRRTTSGSSSRAVQRRLQRHRLLVREQHQHARRRHAPDRLQERADARHQPVHPEVVALQEGQGDRRSPATTCAKGSPPCCRSR